MRGASLELYETDVPVPGSLRLRFDCAGRGSDAAFDLPIGGCGVVELVACTAEVKVKRGSERQSRLIAFGSGQVPLCVPGVPAGCATKNVRPADRSSLWWNEDELRELAADAGIVYRCAKPVCGQTLAGASASLFRGSGMTDVHSRVELASFMLTMAPFVTGAILLLPFGLAFGVVRMALGVLIALAAIGGLVAGLLRLLLETGWMESEPPARHREGSGTSLW